MSELSLVRRGGGKKSVSGQVVLSASTKTFTCYDTSYTSSSRYISVSGIGFKASVIVVVADYNSSTYYTGITVFNARSTPVTSGKTADIVCLNYQAANAMLTEGGGDGFKLTGEANVTDNGFCIPVAGSAGATLTYFAFE